MNLQKTLQLFVLATLGSLPLAFTTGCTGPLPGNSATTQPSNSTESGEFYGIDDAEVGEYSNTTN